MPTPGLKQLLPGVGALPQREPQAGLDGLDVGPVSDPGLAGGLAAHRIDPADDLAFLVSGHCRLARLALHPDTPSTGCEATASRPVVPKDALMNTTRVILTQAFYPGIKLGNL